MSAKCHKQTLAVASCQLVFGSWWRQLARGVNPTGSLQSIRALPERPSLRTQLTL
jgi:hypothetical protein